MIFVKRGYKFKSKSSGNDIKVVKAATKDFFGDYRYDRFVIANTRTNGTADMKTARTVYRDSIRRRYDRSF